MADNTAKPAAGGPPAAPAAAPEPSSAAPPASTAAVRGASLLIGLQIASRAATFVANQLLLRFLTAELLGAAAQLEVYYLSVLFFARESLRVAIQRQGGKNGRASSSATSSQAAINLAYVSVLLGTAVALLLGWLFRASVVEGGANAVAATPFLLPGLYLYAVAAVVELLSEPAFVVLQLRLQFGARAAAESVATVLRCATTLGCAALFSGALGSVPWLGRLFPAAASAAAASAADGGNAPPAIGVLPFALGQLVYGLSLLAVYAWHGAALARREGFRLVPRRLSSGTTTTEANGPSAYALGLFDRATLHLAGSMAAQSVVKHILTQGDMFLVSILSTPAAQGVYVLANNYGGLAARLIFQPIEESSRSYFSRLLAGSAAATTTKTTTAPDAAAVRAGRDLQALLRLYVVLSLVVTALGPAAAAPFLGLVTGPRWAASGAAATLAAYVWYVPLLALNGVAEAFVASVATEAQVHRQSVWMAVFSLVFAAAGYGFLRVADAGAVGLVAANAVNMACRIVWSAVFVRRYFAARRVTSFSLAALLPHPLALLAAVVASGAVQRLVVGRDPAPAAAAAQITQLAQIAAIGVPFVLVVAFFERKFLRQCYSLARGDS